MLDRRERGGSGSRTKTRPIQCEECTIQIGEGYQESIPFEFVDDALPRPKALVVCWRCWESLTRRKIKRQANPE